MFFKFIQIILSLSSILLISGCVYDLPSITYIRPVPIVTEVVTLDCPQTCIQKREVNIASCYSSYNNCLLNGYYTCSNNLNSCRLNMEDTYNNCYNGCGGNKTNYTAHTQTSNTYINQNNINYINQPSAKQSSSYDQSASSNRRENEQRAYTNHQQQSNNYNNHYNQSSKESQQPKDNKKNEKKNDQQENNQQQNQQRQSVIIPPPPSSDLDKKILNQNPQASESAKLRLAEKLEKRRKQEAERNADLGVIELPGN